MQKKKKKKKEKSVKRRQKSSDYHTNDLSRSPEWKTKCQKSMPNHSMNSLVKNWKKIALECFIQTIFQYTSKERVKALTEKLIRKRADTITIDMTIILTMNLKKSTAQIHTLQAQSTHWIHLLLLGEEIKCTHTPAQRFGLAHAHTVIANKKKKKWKEKKQETESRNSNNDDRELFEWKCWAKRAPIST